MTKFVKRRTEEEMAKYMARVEAWPILYPRTMFYPLRVGSVLFHGTRKDSRFRKLKGPAFLTQDLWSSSYFGGTKTEGGTRRLYFRIEKLPTLLNKNNSIFGATGKFNNMGLNRLLGPDRVVTGKLNNVRLAHAFCKSSVVRRLGIDGWKARFPSEIMLCKPMQFLRYEKDKKLLPQW